MRVAIFSDTLSPQINGVTNTLAKLTEYFRQNKIDYRIYAPKYNNSDTGLNTERYYSLKFFLYPECRIALPNYYKISKSLQEFKPRRRLWGS